MPDLIAFLVIKQEIALTDELPQRTEQVTVRSGEIHLVAPDSWQASTIPFPPGMVFLWFHYAVAELTPLDEAATDAAVRELYQPAAAPTARRWLLPRHLDLGNELDAYTRDHTELLETVRLWGVTDPGSQVQGLALAHRLHRSFIRHRLHGQSITRHRPELAHVGRARAWIRLHHERKVSLAQVARAVDLNPAYLARCFRAVTGQSVGEAILDARIEAAKRLLLDGHSVKATASLAGFGSASYFCRLFQRSTGISPLGYRDRAQRPLGSGPDGEPAARVGRRRL